MSEAPTDIPTNDAPAPVADDGEPASVDTTILGGEPAADANAEGGDPAVKADDAKADGKPSIVGAPESYELTMPEGVSFDKDAFEAVEPIMRELDLNQEAASKLVGAYAEKVLPMLQERAAKAGDEAGANLRAEWARETQADPEIGGAKLEETKAMAAKAMAQFLPQGEQGQKFRTFLNESGLGNNAEMVRMLSRVGRAISEGALDQTTAGVPEKTREQKYYG